MIKQNHIEREHPSGLKIISENIPYIYSVSFGLFFKQGSRYDPPELQGISHLIEHMLFKGTRNKSSKDILSFLEEKGGISDGFTGKEVSGIYIRAPMHSYKELAILLKEIIEEPSFDEKELEKEKMVVLSEMHTSKENPEERIVDLLFESVFGNDPLGKPIIGEKNTILKISKNDLIDFYKKNYTIENTIYIIVGRIEDDFYPEIRIGSGSVKTPLVNIPESKPLMEERKDLTQIYVALGAIAPGINSEEKYALSLAATALGGGMSSRLFQKMREEKALVYSVSSFYNPFEDTGIIGIQFVVDVNKVEESFLVLKKELEKIKREGFKEKEVEISKNLVKSSLILGMENSYSRMIRMANWKLLTGEIPKIEEIIKNYESKSPEEVSFIFNKFFNSKKKGLAAVGAIEEKVFEKIKEGGVI